MHLTTMKTTMIMKMNKNFDEKELILEFTEDWDNGASLEQYFYYKSFMIYLKNLSEKIYGYINF